MSKPAASLALVRNRTTERTADVLPSRTSTKTGTFSLKGPKPSKIDPPSSALAESGNSIAKRLRTSNLERERRAACGRHRLAEIEALRRAESWPGLSAQAVRQAYLDGSGGRNLDFWELPPLTGKNAESARWFNAWQLDLPDIAVHARGFNSGFLRGKRKLMSSITTMPLFEPVDGVTPRMRIFADTPVIDESHPLYARILRYVEDRTRYEANEPFKRSVLQIRGELEELSEPCEPYHDERGYHCSITVFGDGLDGGGFHAPMYRGYIYVYREVIPNEDGGFTRMWFGRPGGRGVSTTEQDPEGLDL